MALLKSMMGRLRKGLDRTRKAMGGGLRALLGGKRLDENLIRDLERALIQSDTGVATTRKLITGVRDAYKTQRLNTGDEVIEYLKRELKALWPEQDRALHFSADPGVPTVILVAGVNGAGKTTSIAKLAHALHEQNKSVLLAACDTYRAGAVRQLEIWAERLDMQVVKGQQGGDPAAVAFDAAEAAISRNVDVLIVDTAGRLHTQDSLMRQLTKIRDVVRRRIPQAPHEVLLVLDATTGQNATQQARQFAQAIDVTGIFLTKLDGTARGGVVIAIQQETNIPVKFIGVGETPADVEPFDPDRFVDALFADE
ncbi:MAG: signal recognition particle-docking protein FtsY [Phycisphaeraceae bacterium]|nr:signal recognition particle-docking protein FtsY [Phycisphaeraceae bacterium]